jgi:predicted enzyme related to lactoylglutathione lyase
MSIQFKEIAFSCYSVTDFARARGFYEGVLGLKSTALYGEAGGMQWGEYDIGSGTLSIGSAPQFKPSADGCTVALEVVDFPAAIAHLRSHNVVFRLEPMETPGCHLACICDPDSNPLFIHKRKHSA